MLAIIAITLSFASFSCQQELDQQTPLLSHPKVRCPPQKTPLYGKKWCSFAESASEVGAICHFSCNKGYFLTQTEVNECVEQHTGIFALFNASVGHCLPRPPPLNTGSNGPFIIRSMFNITHWDVDERHRLVDVSTPRKTNFHVEKPGLNGNPDSVSFRSTTFPDRYVVMQGKKVLLIDKNSTSQWLGAFEDNCSFLFRQDKFFQGYASFESYAGNGFFISVVFGKVEMVKPDTRVSKMSSSFTWIPI